MTRMKMKKLEMQRLEDMKTWIGKSVMAIALFGALSVVSPSEGYAKDMKELGDGAVAMEMAKPSKKTDLIKTIDFGTQMQEMMGSGVDTLDVDQESKGLDLDGGDDQEPEDLGSDGGPDQGKDLDKSSGSRIKVHGFVQVGSGVVPDLATVCSDKPTFMLCVDASDAKTGLGLTVIRMDDFHSDPEWPASKATAIGGHRGKSFKDGKLSVGAEGQYTFIDALPDADGLSAKAVLSYSIDSGWTFEGKYIHGFKKGADSKAFRLGVSKKISEILKLTAQGWYQSDYDGKFFGRVTVDIDLGGGFGAQMSCLAKDGKLTPTAGVVYQF